MRVCLLDRDVGDGRTRHGHVAPQRAVVEPERVFTGGQPVEDGAVERPAGNRPLVDQLVGTLFVLPSRADFDLDTVQVRSGVENQGPDARPQVEHHVLGPGVVGVVVVRHDEGVSKPSWGEPRYGNLA
jgi:hypothetical protein